MENDVRKKLADSNKSTILGHYSRLSHYDDESVSEEAANTDSQCLLRGDPQIEDASDRHIPLGRSFATICSKRLPWTRRWHTKVDEVCPTCEKTPPARRSTLRVLAMVGLALVLILMVAISINALAPVIVPDELHQIIKSWGKPGQVGEGLSSWPTDFSRGIFPIPCHSHNDYWRLVPLYSAIEAGCISVEADIWLINDELYVGHTPASLTPNRTLDSLYISPLLDILSKQNPSTSFHDGDASLDGVFDTTPSQSLVLLIDFKTPGSELWPHVLAALQPLRDRGYLTHVNGTQIVQRPITVVGTGNTPFDLVSSVVTNPHLDVFFDAPLGEMYVEEGNEHSKAQHNASISADSDVYTTVNSFYASVSFGEVFGHLFYGEFSEQQLTTLRGQLRGAHEKGLKARYWDLPFWPIGLRNHVWDVLVNEGVDLLNVDDLKGATEKDWKKSKGWW